MQNRDYINATRSPVSGLPLPPSIFLCHPAPWRRPREVTEETLDPRGAFWSASLPGHRVHRWPAVTSHPSQPLTPLKQQRHPAPSISSIFRPTLKAIISAHVHWPFAWPGSTRWDTSSALDRYRQLRLAKTSTPDGHPYVTWLSKTRAFFDRAKRLTPT